MTGRRKPSGPWTATGGVTFNTTTLLAWLAAAAMAVTNLTLWVIL